MNDGRSIAQDFVLPQIVTIIDISVGEKISQLDQSSIDDLETRIKNKKSNKNLSHDSMAMLHQYKHLAIRLRMHACWKYEKK